MAKEFHARLMMLYLRVKSFDCMKEIRAAKVKAPIKIGDVLIKDVAHTGINVVATKDID